MEIEIKAKAPDQERIAELLRELAYEIERRGVANGLITGRGFSLTWEVPKGHSDE